MQQLILTIIFYALIVAILMMVFLMWRTGVRERQKLTQTLVDATLKSTEAAKDAAEAVRVLAEKEHPP